MPPPTQLELRREWGQMRIRGDPRYSLCMQDGLLDAELCQLVSKLALPTDEYPGQI